MRDQGAIATIVAASTRRRQLFTASELWRWRTRITSRCVNACSGRTCALARDSVADLDVGVAVTARAAWVWIAAPAVSSAWIGAHASTSEVAVGILLTLKAGATAA